MHMSVVLKYVCITCRLSTKGGQKRELDSLELGVMGCWKLPCGYQELNLCPLVRASALNC